MTSFIWNLFGIIVRIVFMYLIYLYRDNAQHKCSARVSYKAHLHLQSLGRMFLFIIIC